MWYNAWRTIKNRYNKKVRKHVIRDQLKCDGTRAETRFRLSAKRTSPFKSAGGRQFSRLLAVEDWVSAVVMCYQVRFITRSVKCMVTMRWAMAWLGNGFGRSMKDERTCMMRREMGVRLWWMMIWCVRSTKECVRTDVSQFLICPCTFVRFQGLYSMTLSVVANIAGDCILWGGYTETCAPLR